jgi:hypothetical protein
MQHRRLRTTYTRSEMASDHAPPQAHDDDLGTAGASERRDVGGLSIEQRVPSDRLLRRLSRLRQDVDGGLQRSIRHAHYAAERVV